MPTELERWQEHHKEFAAIEEFLHWMSDIHQTVLTEFVGQKPYILSEGVTHDKMYEFFGIDRVALEQERCAVLAQFAGGEQSIMRGEET